MELEAIESQDKVCKAKLKKDKVSKTETNRIVNEQMRSVEAKVRMER